MQLASGIDTGGTYPDAVWGNHETVACWYFYGNISRARRGIC